MVFIDIILTTSGETPIYQQIVDQIKAAILRGDLEAEELLPSIRVLAKELKISVITTKRAYEELEKEGLIYTMRGKGSFVADQGEHLLEESKERLVEEKLLEAMEVAKLTGLTKSEFGKIFKRLMEGKEWNRF